MSALLTDSTGQQALALAAAQDDPGSVQAATRLRAQFSSELATAALHQEALRRRARAKLGDRAADMLFTADGLEQATRPEVSRWRFARLVAAGITRVVDLGCGIGADAMAALDAGLDVVTIERDAEVAEFARHNLAVANGQAGPGTAEVVVADAIDWAAAHLHSSSPTTAVLLDPARRTDRGRTWRVEDLSPPWDFVLDVLAAGRPAVVKLGPGIDRSMLPQVPTSHVSHGGDAVETTLWGGPPGVAFPGVEAVVIDRAGTVHTLSGQPRAVPFGPLGSWLHEPDPAVSRAGLVGLLGDDLVQLDPTAGYYSGNVDLTSPFVTSFEVLEVLEASPRRLKAWVREHGVGTLEIKKRGRGGLLDVDPAALRRQLKPKGPASATIVLAPTGEGVRAIVCRRAG
ncbi:THUMP-like domain-containing protein [Propionibacteriaceae bacterium G57]|uniref:class I SAM-dependent methyltransferase n=1 Tax=Aestuariimicrobium sp. G57 TaxID=3418485 RepID=UPI003DA72B5D